MSAGARFNRDSSLTTFFPLPMIGTTDRARFSHLFWGSRQPLGGNRYRRAHCPVDVETGNRLPAALWIPLAPHQANRCASASAIGLRPGYASSSDQLHPPTRCLCDDTVLHGYVLCTVEEAQSHFDAWTCRSSTIRPYDYLEHRPPSSPANP